MENGFSSAFYFSCQWNVQMIWVYAGVSTWLQFHLTHSASCLRTSEVSSSVGIGLGRGSLLPYPVLLPSQHHPLTVTFSGSPWLSSCIPDRRIPVPNRYALSSALIIVQKNKEAQWEEGWTKVRWRACAPCPIHTHSKNFKILIF